MPGQVVRQTRIKLSLGSEQLKLVRLDAFEALSQAFLVVLDVLSDHSELDLMPHLGKVASVESLVDNEHQRYFSGVIVEGRFIEEAPEGGYLYRLTLRPKSFFHEQGSNFRIFQDMSVIDIVKSVLEQCSIDYEARIQGQTPVLSYCVQYGESDFAFASRMMEEHGLYYFYEHQDDAHTLVLCDAKSAHQPVAVPSLTYNPDAAVPANADSSVRQQANATYVTTWHEHVSSNAERTVTLRDYDFMTPASPREAAMSDDSKHPGDEIEVYGWPGRYYKQSDGRNLSSHILESRRAQRIRYDGASAYTGIQTGRTFQLSKHPIPRFDRGYLLIGVRTSISTEQYRSGDSGGATHVEFTAIPDDVQFRAPMTTRRPLARGPESAVVTGPPGEEIHTDKYGRVKVQFHWDRQGKLDDRSSCWLRVSQTGGLGNIILPRINQEVLVDFINGDPDRPIVVGRLFNESHMPVYALPEHKTKALWRTKTYKKDSGATLADALGLDTGAPGANELRFEDKTGAEELFVHAEKDMNTRVRNDETHHVGRHVDIVVGKNRTETVHSNETITIKADRTETVEGKETVSVTGDRKVEIKSSDKLDVTKTLTITAGQEILLKVGSSSIKIGPTSITIKTIKLEMEGSAKAKLSGALTNVEATALLTAKGALVKIN